MITACEGQRSDLLKTRGGVVLIGELKCATSVARVAALQEIGDLISETTSSLNTEEVVGRFGAPDAPGAPIREFQDVLCSPHFRVRGMGEDIQVPGLGRLPLFDSPSMSWARVATRGNRPQSGRTHRRVFGDWLGYTATN
jgi:crotonobetainyl-CoA:carnitine CoA-transferase CaiB-like acyl-CoA transferase